MLKNWSVKVMINVINVVLLNWDVIMNWNVMNVDELIEELECDNEYDVVE
jgi:hypothetical protein